ncbi:MAG: glutathione synthase, partial [Nitrosomonas sp.]|nr:glutathione synthase [Nitrosomonas sp.]
INVTSPTGMQEITKQTGFNVAGMMLDAIEEGIEKKRQ